MTLVDSSPDPNLSKLVGQKISFEATDFFARIVQHEVDHLNGELFIFKAKNIQEEYEEETDERI